MARINPVIQTMNRGRLGAIGLGRTDLDRTRLSAEIQTNFLPRTLGSMMLRPGLGYVGSVNNSSTAILVPFVFDVKDTALLEFTSTTMRVWASVAGNSRNVDLVEREPSTAAITLGNFSSTLLGGWTDIDDSGATSEWFGSTAINNDSTDFLSLVGTRFVKAGRRQSVTVGDSTTIHGLRITVARGRAFLTIGTSAGGQEYRGLTELRPGTFSFAVPATTDFSFDITANTDYRTLIQSVSIDSSGPLKLDSTWTSSDLQRVRYTQSADVVFCANRDYWPKRIERYSTYSWAIVDYDPLDGPFSNINISAIQLTGSTLRGDITLFADQPFFRTGHTDKLFRLTSRGQTRTFTVSATDQNTAEIRVTGVGESRRFRIITQAFGNATIQLQRSVGEIGSWEDVTGISFTANASTDFADGLNNQIVYYRLLSTAYASGSPVGTLRYEAGGLAGIVKINSVFSATESSARVLTDLGSTEKTDLWQEGDWSSLRGYPSAVNFHEGRLWWAGKAHVWGSVADGFESFDEDIEGDAGPLNRTIARGAVDTIEWIGSIGTMVLGGQSRELQAKTDSLEQPLTPDNFNLRDISDQGSANVQAVEIDNRLVFVQKSGIRVYEVAYGADSLTYTTRDLSVLVPEIGEPEIVRMAVQRQPDTRVHCIRGSTDGTAAVLLSDKAENVLAWIDIETGEANGYNGRIEEVAVLPSTVEDAVYYTVRREINGSTQLFIERMALERNAQCLPTKSWATICVTGPEST